MKNHIMFKAASKREESDAHISYSEREQARSAASMFNVQCGNGFFIAFPA